VEFESWNDLGCLSYPRPAMGHLPPLFLVAGFWQAQKFSVKFWSRVLSKIKRGFNDGDVP
jgi:hypothetical protein